MAIPLSVLDLEPVRLGGTIAASFSNDLSPARHTENLGYRRFWLAEHHNMAGIASAGGTSRIRVGSGGIMLPNHSPLVIVEQFGTLGILYPWRTENSDDFRD